MTFSKAPKLRLNMAMALDGHVAHPTQAWEFGSAEDRRRMDRLREWADCLIVSRKTLEHDNMNLTVRTKPHAKKHPRPVIVMQSAKPLKPGLRILKNSAIEGELWISGKGPELKIADLWPDLGEDWKIYRFENVREIVQSLEARGYQKILLEGGPTLKRRFFHRRSDRRIFPDDFTHAVGGHDHRSQRDYARSHTTQKIQTQKRRAAQR